MQAHTQDKPVYTKFFKAYLAEDHTGTPDEDGGEFHQNLCRTKVVFSKDPFTPAQFTPLVMGVLEAYAEQLLTNNDPESVYQHFNNAFGTFLRKLVPEDYVYEHSDAHKAFKKHADGALNQPEDRRDTEENRLAAYLLARDILTEEAHFSEETADLILNRRLGLLSTPAPASKDVEHGEKEQG